MKKTLSILAFLLFHVVTFSQGIDPSINLGEGAVTVLQYAFPPPPERPAREKLEPQAMAHYFPNLSYTYYIKENKVLLRSQDDKDAPAISSNDTITSNDGVGLATSLTIRYVHPVYLIDCIKRTVSYLSDSTGRIVRKSLSETSAEPFYRNVNIISPKQATILSIPDSGETYIAGKKCFKGMARDCDGKSFVFYYCKEPIGVCSPMNNLFPANFPYNILRYEFPIQWSYTNGTVSQDGLLIFQVSEIKSCAVPDSVMIPPRNSFPVN